MFTLRPVKTVGIALLMLLFSQGAQAEFYTIVIKGITSESVSGDVIVEFRPGKKEDGFNGKAKAKLLGTDSGTSRSLALLITAVSLGTEAVIELPTPPTFDVVQTIISSSITP